MGIHLKMLIDILLIKFFTFIEGNLSTSNGPDGVILNLLLNLWPFLHEKGLSLPAHPLLYPPQAEQLSWLQEAHTTNILLKVNPNFPVYSLHNHCYKVAREGVALFCCIHFPKFR